MTLDELYQDLILDHKRHPRNKRRIAHPDRAAEGFNPVCGDRVTVYLDLEGDRIRDVSFEGAGCAISVASASLMTEALKGKTRAEAERLFEAVRELLTGSGPAGAGGPAAGELGKLAALSGVRAYPVRVKCATLCWHAMHAALSGKAEPVTTESQSGTSER